MSYLKDNRWDNDDPGDDPDDDSPYDNDSYANDSYANDSYANDSYGDEADESTTACPFCGEEIYEDAERCPECGKYIAWSDADGDQHAPSQFTKRPLWIIVTAVLLIYAMLHAYVWPMIVIWQRG